MVSFCRLDISSVSEAKPIGAASDCPFSFSQSSKTDETVLKDAQLFMHRIEYVLYTYRHFKISRAG